MRLKIYFLIIFFFCTALLLYSREIVSGTWSDSIYIIENDIVLVSGDTLIIQSGVNISFNGNFEFEVSGSLIVMGTEESPVIFQPTNSFSHWKGIRFKNNNSSYDSSYIDFAWIKHAMNEDGGGINISYYDEIKIDNSKISDCHATNGGGLYLYNANIEITNSVIENNSAENFAGGIAILNSHLTMENVTIRDNYSASDAGGIYIKSCRPTILNCEISNNIAARYGGGIQTRLLYIGSVIQDCIFRNNFAGSRGGGCYVDDGWIYLYSTEFDSNESYLGGGCHFAGAHGYFENCLIVNNSANFGGGMYLSASASKVVNSMINYNYAEFGGGIYSIGNSNPVIYNSNILQNRVAYNGGGYYTVGDDEAYLINSIIYYNFSDVWGDNQISINSPNYGTYVLNCNIQGGLNGITGHPELMIPPYYVNNLEEEPEFTDIENDFSLLHTSPCIDSGTLVLPNGNELPEFDLAGNTRIYGNNVDIGAYEWQGVENDVHEIPHNSLLISHISNFPNPFNPSTTIQFSNEQFEQNEQITIEIYNIKGQRVKQFKMKNENFKMNEVVWDGNDEFQKPVSSGIYLYKISTGKEAVMSKMLLLK